MAEINELLELANEETSALVSDLTRLRQVLSRLNSSATSLEESLDHGVSETQKLIDVLSLRLEESEEELGREVATATGRLANLEVAARESLAASDLLASRAKEGLGALRAEREHQSQELETLAETARNGTVRYATQARETSSRAEEGLKQVAGSLALLRQQADETRSSVSERRDLLVGEANAFEARLRGDMQHVLRAYDILTAGIERQLREIQTSAQSLSEQVASRLERRLSQEALEGLSQAAAPLKDTLVALERFAERGRDRASSKLTQVSVAIEDVARALDRMQPPLGQVKQYLR